MKTNTQVNARINERVINAILIVLVFFIAFVYSKVANAQEMRSIQYTGNDPVNQVISADKKINMLKNSNPDAKAEPLSSTINSPYAELKPTLSPDGSKLYFSRLLHPANTSGNSENEDIWYAERNKITNTWSSPLRLVGGLNNSGPNFINNVSATGDTLILGNQYGRKGRMRAGLSYSVNDRGQWSAPMNINIQNDYNMSGHANAFVSLKSGIIIQAVQREETYGHRDLYVSFWDGAQASEPINMGGVINSDLEESSPFLAADNKTLYFASKGHAGFGGYDIFVTTRLDESWTNWTTPENLGPAVNGAMDDEFFSISQCGKYALFSKQVSVHNTDLFKITTHELFGTPEDKEVAPSNNRNSIVAAL